MEISRLKINDGDMIVITGPDYTSCNTIQQAINSWLYNRKINVSVTYTYKEGQSMGLVVLSTLSLDEVFEKEVLR